MGCEFGFVQPWCQWLGPLANNDDSFASIRTAFGAFSKPELRLARVNQFDVDLGENLGVEQRSVLGSA